MSHCDCMELVCFTIGALVLLKWAWRGLVLIRNLFLGTKVTPQRYGENSWAVVTGSTDGIGKALALELAKRGFNIVLIARNSEKLAAVAKDIQNKYGRDTRMIVFDFSKETSFAAYEHIVRLLDDIDVSILINNVGMSNKPDDQENHQLKDVHAEVVVNCYPIVILTKLLVDRLKLRYKKTGKRSLILNVASQITFIPNPYLAGYCSSKNFDDKFTKSLYYEMKGTGVDVLGLLPGAVSTGLNGFSEVPFAVIGVQSCATGTLNNATSFVTFGGWVHEIHGFLVKNFMLDLVPQSILIKLTRGFAEGLKKSWKLKVK
ncbi:short chain dehydrogenase reductase family protein [Stylonychia lemnae]|uniref:Short chain dehydrogenase reductase family protein n=1 Tax=Stylonychia lemnae TaxID=5949 RepID=A0A078AIJ6_STYLE|nr:short chain dehydrogenase reductase family protein [Stylonychia lemnae]|eukprot:CDW81761.1 short chain dehydrogenase reductase family protein [Stylonychia lemnae]